MKDESWISRLFRRPKASPIQRVQLEQLNEIMGWGGSNNGKPVINNMTALTIPTVWRAINIVASSMARFPIDVVKKTSDNTREAVDDHPVAMALTRRPNQFQDAYQFRRQLQTHMLLRGNAYALIIPQLSSTSPLELIPLQPDSVTPRLRDDYRMEYQVTRKGREPQTLPANRILHLRGLSYDGVTGISPITAARESFSLALEAQRARSRYYAQGTFAGYAIKHPGKLSTPARDALRKNIRDNGGIMNTGDPPILEEGMEVVSLGFTSQDAQFLESTQFQIREIARWFGLPPHMLGDTEKSTSWGSGIEHQSIGFVQYTLDDWIGVWQSAIETQLLDAQRDLQVRIQTASLLRGDQKTQHDVFAKGREWGYYSANDIRRFLDMPPIDNGDVYIDPGANTGNNTNEPANEPAVPDED